MAEIILNLNHVSVSLAGRPILQDLSWEVQAGQRIGLVGRNGAGKSTLLKLIAQQLAPDSVADGRNGVGALFRKSGLTCGYLEQEPVFRVGRTLLQEALTAVPALEEVEKKLAQVEARLADPAVYQNSPALERALAQHERLLTEYESLDGRRHLSRVKAMLQRLGLGAEQWQTLTEHLSGGQKKLVQLAKLAVQLPELLLLDEPDNHLDIPAKRKLEEFINGYAGCIIIISHDRYLLDEVAGSIAELENGRLNLYQGNYSVYVSEREIRRLRQQQVYAAQQKEIARIEAAIARFELWASIVVDERHIRQARHRQKMLDKMDKVEKVSIGRHLTLTLPGWRGSKKVVELVNATRHIRRGESEVALLDNLNLTLWHGERVGLVGPNGAGKSMLLKHLVSVEALDGGSIKIGPSCRVGYYAQEQETLAYDRSLIDEIRQVAPLSQEATVAFLNRFLFTYDQMRGRIVDLSGGERSRLQLAKLVLQQPNLLLLDEPTNNLDIAAIEVLEETLEEFEGTVLVISHDRYFLDKIVDRIVELRDGTLAEFSGGYTDYLAACAT
jgi:ATP-binding cassette, subfamily F, member 3